MSGTRVRNCKSPYKRLFGKFEGKVLYGQWLAVITRVNCFNKGGGASSLIERMF